MSSISNEAKLAQLRTKTDAELARYITRELNLAFHLAAQADDECCIQAEAICVRVAKLLLVLRDLDRAEHERIASRLQRLREILDAQGCWSTGAVRTAASVS